MAMFHSEPTAGWIPRASRLGAFAVAAMLVLLALAPAGFPAQPLGKKEIEAVLHQDIVRSGPWKEENVEVRVLSFQPVSVTAAPVTFRILKPEKGVTPGLQNFLLAAETSGKEAARFWARAEIKVFEEVVVTSHPVAHHETIAASSVRLERRDISPLSARPFLRVAEVVGQQASRSIEVNEVLTPKMIERATLVRRGSAVVLLYETGALRVEAPGIANEAGKIGDVIQVKNASSGKLLRGVLVDARSVRVN